MTSTHEIVYDQAVRAVEQQVRQLDELRSRTAVVFAASGVVAGFLGRAALAEGLEAWGYMALATFVLGALASLYVLWPRWESWEFSIDAKALMPYFLDEAKPEPPEALYRYLAGAIQDDFVENKKALERLYGGFVLACTAVTVQVVLWFLAVL